MLRLLPCHWLYLACYTTKHLQASPVQVLRFVFTWLTIHSAIKWAPKYMIGWPVLDKAGTSFSHYLLHTFALISKTWKDIFNLNCTELVTNITVCKHTHTHTKVWGIEKHYTWHFQSSKHLQTNPCNTEETCQTTSGPRTERVMGFSSQWHWWVLVSQLIIIYSKHTDDFSF